MIARLTDDGASIASGGAPLSARARPAASPARAAARIAVDYEVLPSVTDPAKAQGPVEPQIH